jgi:hypothetical protein
MAPLLQRQELQFSVVTLTWYNAWCSKELIKSIVNDGSTPLIIGALKDHTALGQYLAQQGADKNEAHNADTTYILHRGARRSLGDGTVSGATGSLKGQGQHLRRNSSHHGISREPLGGVAVSGAARG